MKRDLERENRGLSAFALLQGLDDDTVLSATLPAPKKRGFFAAVASRPMAAMLISVAVALTVLSGVLLAGRLGGGLFPSWEDPWIETQPGPPQTRPDIDSGILYPPMNENPDQAEKSQVTVVSDGITVYPKGYCVYISEQRRNEQGELECLDGDGYGAVYQLAEIWDELPILRTAGNDFDAVLPDHMTLRSVRVFEMVEVQTKTFEEIASTVDGPNLSVDPMGYLSTLRGEYTVVLEIYHETIYSADEYTKGVDEYAFRLSVDPSMNDNAPVRILHGDKTYFPTGYLLQTIYYDAELKQEVTKQYDGAERILAELAPAMVTATVARGESLGLYLAPFYELKWVRVFDSSLRRLYEMGYDSPLDTFSETEEAGDYYVIITAVFLGTGETSVTEFPIHIKVVEEREEESTPAGDVGETPDEPTDPLDRVLSKAEPMTPQTPDGTPLPDGSVLVGQTALYMPCFENGSSLGKRVSRMAVYRDGKNPYIHHLYADVLTDDGHIMMSETQEIHGYFVLLEYDGNVVLATMEGDPSPDGTACTVYGTMEIWLSWTDADNMSAEDLGDIRLQRVEYDHWVQEAPMEKLEKTIVKTMGRKWDQLSTILRAYGGAENFGVLMDFWTNSLSPRVYRHADSTSAEAVEARSLILNVDQPNFDTVWAAFVARINDRIEGILPPPLPETNPRVVVASRHGSAVFETEEDGFLAWTAYRLGVAISWMPRVEGTPAASVIFDDNEAMRALPDMEIAYGDALTVTLDAAGDALFKVILYDAKGEIVAEGLDLSVVGTLENEGWDQHVIVVLQVISRVSETEQACYEYAFELYIVQP